MRAGLRYCYRYKDINVVIKIVNFGLLFKHNRDLEINSSRRMHVLNRDTM